MLGFDRATDERTATFEKMKQTPIGDIGLVLDEARGIDWKVQPISTEGRAFQEPLVPLGAFSTHNRIFTDAIYAGEHKESSPYPFKALNGSLLTMFARKGVADKLVAAAEMLPDGYELMVWDAYRPFDVQKALYDHCLIKKIQSGKYKTLDDAKEATAELVSLPSTEDTRPSPHNTGGSIDVTIIRFEPAAAKKLKRYREELTMVRAQGVDTDREFELESAIRDLFRTKTKPLNMGVRFDEETPATPMRYYEERLEKGEKLKGKEREALENRRVLAHIMQSVGFSVYEKEPWHFDCGNQFDAVKRGTPALYGAITLSEENLTHEAMRDGHYRGTRDLKMNPHLLDGRQDPDALSALREARRASRVDHIEDHPKAQQL